MNWYAKGPARRTYVARDEDGVTRNLYFARFVSEGYLTPHTDYRERYIEFFALKPGKAVKAIAAAGAPLSMDKTIIN